jgi:hypothetical protein
VLNTTLTLDDASGDDVTYVQVPFQGLGVRRIVRGRAVTLPKEMIIQHNEANNGSKTPDRRVVSFRETALDSKGVPATAIVNFTVQAPRSDAITSQMIKDMVANLCDFLTDGAISSIATMDNVEAFLGGEA